jgi:hypothetical protein
MTRIWHEWYFRYIRHKWYFRYIRHEWYCYEIVWIYMEESKKEI